MVYRINLSGVLTLYSEQARDMVISLVEEGVLFDYISTLVNTGAATRELADKISMLTQTSGGKAEPEPVVQPERAEKVSAPMKGSAAKALGKMRKLNKKE